MITFVLEARFENAYRDPFAFVIATKNITRLREPNVAAQWLTKGLSRISATSGLPPPASSLVSDLRPTACASRPGGQLAERIEHFHQFPKPDLSVLRKGIERRSKTFRLGAV